MIVLLDGGTMVVPSGDAVEPPPELELLDEPLPDELEPPPEDELDPPLLELAPPLLELELELAPDEELLDPVTSLLDPELDEDEEPLEDEEDPLLDVLLPDDGAGFGPVLLPLPPAPQAEIVIANMTARLYRRMLRNRELPARELDYSLQVSRTKYQSLQLRLRGLASAHKCESLKRNTVKFNLAMMQSTKHWRWPRCTT